MSTAPPVSNTARMMDLLFGFTLSRSISMAAQLGIADLIKERPRSAEELAHSVHVHPRSLYRMLRALAGNGIFSEEPNGKFALTPLAETLCSDAPESLRSFATFIADTVSFEAWANMHVALQSGKAAFPQRFGMPWFAYLEKTPDEAKVFHDAMTSLSTSAAAAVVAAYDFSGIKTLVDVGGGHGLLLAAILAKYPSMTGILFDAPQVVADADKLLSTKGVHDRCATVGGDFFASAPAGGDAYILKHIIHDWNDEECVTILRHCHRGMIPGGKVLLVEMVIPEPNVASIAKWLDLEMMVFLTGKERTKEEYRELLAKAGFELTRIVPTPSVYSVIEGDRK